jgi:hypothetical protein
MAERAGESERAEEGDNKWGPRVSEREGERARTRAGCAGAIERGRGRVAAGPFGWAEPGERKRSRPELSFCFSFSEI